MKRRITSILTLVVLLHFQSKIQSQEITNIHSLFANASSTAINICWRSNILVKNPAVEYGTTKAYGKTIKAISNKSGDGFNYQVELKGLPPGTVYHYRCTGSGKFSNDCTFKTSSSKSKNFTFAVVGDVQGKTNSHLWQAAATWLSKQKPAFWIPVGDLVQHGVIQKEWDCFFSDGKVLFESSPIMPVIGNHDCYDEQQKGHIPSLFYTQFPRPTNNSKKIIAWNYSFKYENAAFFILDNYPAAGDHAKNNKIIKEIETKWLDTELATANSKWKFVFFHPPVYSSGGHGGDTLWLKDFWGKAIDKYHVDAVFTGHTHAFEITHPIKDGKKVDSPLDGTIYYNTAGINFSDKAKGNWFTDVLQEKVRMPLVALVKVSENTIEIQTYNWKSNTLYHSKKINKSTK